MTRWIDTHCHLDAAEFGPDTLAVRTRARSRGVTHCVLPAVEAGNFEAVRRLAHEGEDSYALGIHPLRVAAANEADLALLSQALVEQSGDARLVAVGEIGLDHFALEPGVGRQDFFYREQLLLAQQHGLPVILHVRRSADQLLKQLRKIPVRGIAHAFNGSEQQAHEFIKLGFKLGFGGAVTHARALQLRRLAGTLPLSAVVLETDSPDIPPHWLYRTAQERADGRPQGRNEPGELPAIADVIAQLRGISVQALAEATTRNAIEALPRLRALLATDVRVPPTEAVQGV